MRFVDVIREYRERERERERETLTFMQACSRELTVGGIVNRYKELAAQKAAEVASQPSEGEAGEPADQGERGAGADNTLSKVVFTRIWPCTLPSL
jgi:hypothetical protein